jgi:toluene monooxygenase system ferredoxin subunit
MARWVAAYSAGELWPGEMRGLRVENTRVVILNLQGRVHAYLDRCPHLGVALSRGTFEDGIVTCPGHGYRFRADGSGVNPQSCTLSALPVQVEDGRILIDLEGVTPGGGP